MKPRLARSALLLAIVALPARGGVPMNIHHQGVIAVQGERFTGEGLFWFALVEPGTGLYLWTNDGSPLANCTNTTCPPPTDFVALTVINGIYNVHLGGGGMVAIDSSIFEMPDVALRVWFDDDQGNGTHQLAPDQPVASVPFAFRSATIDNDAVTANKIANGAVGNAELALNAVTSSRIQDGTVSAADLAENSVGLSTMTDNAVGTDEVIDQSLQSIDLGPNSVGQSEIQDGSVGVADLGPNSVGNSEMRDDAIGSVEVINGSITSSDLASNSVSQSKLTDNAVGINEMRDNAVGSAEIINNSITSSDLASGSGGLLKVTGGKMRASFAGVVEVLDSQLVLDVDSSTTLSVGQDSVPEVYIAEGQGCDSFHRGAMYIGRVDATGASGQDCLCICMFTGGSYGWVCFNP